MRCLECGTETTRTHGALCLEDSFIGEYIVQDATYFKCKQCSETILAGDTWEKADKEISRKTDQLLGLLSIDDFIGITEVEKILEVTRQAINKSKKIKNGFIYSKKKGGRVFYNRKSVELFKKNQDGRFPLVQQIKTAPIEYITVTDSHIEDQSVFRKPNQINELLAWDKKTTQSGIYHA